MAERLFGTLAEKTADTVGVTRASYGEGEQFAHDLLAATARSLDLDIATDWAGNLYMTLPGRDRSRPALMTGSHLDSVPRGGNYDGAAGVIAAVTAVAALRRAGLRPSQDITVMATRAEESGSWFKGRHGGHLGARMALGLLWPDELETAIRIDTGRSLAWHIAAAGFDPKKATEGPPRLARERIGAWIELHIEQGPVLLTEGYPVGIVTAIRGILAAREVKVLGAYAHAGATPESYRQDAALAAVDFIAGMDRHAEAVRARGGDLTFTVGKINTDAALHSMTKVAGEVRFSMDIRSRDQAALDGIPPVAARLAAEVEARRRARIELGGFAPTPAAAMDAGLRRLLAQGAIELGIRAKELPCGASHDTVDFASVGVPAAMIFVRNANGSHNPDEAMEFADFAEGTRLLAMLLARLSSGD
ncbi:MAG: hydantoinase/carbamoylase family amidase [Proteobacteria bacterium]|nr:hydantoinase/carbamoylase family amidase [Pseudomonadota bacterium]